MSLTFYPSNLNDLMTRSVRRIEKNELNSTFHFNETFERDLHCKWEFIFVFGEAEFSQF